MPDIQFLNSLTSLLCIAGFAIALAAAAAPDAAASSKPAVTHLRTEYLENPLGIDTPEPRFSWLFVQDGRDAKQTAYQIEVATGPSALNGGKPNVWDSGRVSSSNCSNIPLEGQKLASGMPYWWRVRVWDAKGHQSDWSEPATFEMGFLKPAEWRAEWIAAPIGGNGYHSGIDANPDVTKWVQVDIGETRRFSKVILFPARPYNWNEDVPGFGFPVRYRVEASDDADFGSSSLLADRSAEDQPNPGETPVEFTFAPVSARYVRVTVTRLYQRIDGQKLFALAELQVLDDSGQNVAAGAAVRALDSTEAHGWCAAHLTEGLTKSIAPSRVAPMFRAEFDAAKRVRRARAYVVGLGYYELRLNGKKVGDQVLDPSYTNFGTRCLYSTYDVTEMVREGKNAVGLMMGRGWYGGSPCALAQINLDLEDGTHVTFATGPGWKRGESPILDNSLYHGETYDARLEQQGWDEPGFDDSGWQDVSIIAAPTGTLSAQMIQPIRVTETMPVATMKEVGDALVFDFGQNFSGWCQLRAEGPAGHEIAVKHAEILYPDGTINMENLRSAQATDRFTLKGKGKELYEPRFTYHGFRYVQVENYPGRPESKDVLSGRVVHTDFPQHGTFECSNELINQIQRNCIWGFKTNFHSIPTDCPQRDERQGWMGDAGMTSDMGFYNFDMAAAYTKFLQDIQDAQGEDGRIPDTVPHIWGSNPGDPMWAGAYHFIVRDMYRHTGDRQLLVKHYDGLKRYVDMVRREAPEFIHGRNNYGDWVGVVETPRDLISTGAFYLAADIVAEIAEVLGKDADAREYRDLCAKIAAAFNNKFFNAEMGVYGNGSQYSYIWPLFLGIVPQEHHAGVIEKLKHDIMVTHKGHLSTGFLGARYMFELLCDEGLEDVAYTVMNQRDYPSYGFMLAKGATTIWELWKHETGPGMNSHNHPAFGFISGWFYSDIAGITPEWKRACFDDFEIKQHMMGDVKVAKVSVDTVRGKVSSHWMRDGSGVTLKVTIPANSSAAVWVPKDGRADVTITESGRTVWQGGAFANAPGLASAEDAGRWVKFEAGSGSYAFELTAK